MSMPFQCLKKWCECLQKICEVYIVVDQIVDFNLQLRYDGKLKHSKRLRLTCLTIKEFSVLKIDLEKWDGIGLYLGVFHL